MPRDERDSREDVLFEQLYDALGEETLDVASLRESLASAGVNVDRVLREGKRLFESCVAQQKLSRARQRLDRVRQHAASVRESIAASMDAARQEMASILAGEPSGAKYLAYHRKLQKIDRDDLASLNDDAALIDFLERLEGEEQQP